MKPMEIDSRNWTDAERDKAYAKLEELGYVPNEWHGTGTYNGEMSISASPNGYYCGYDLAVLVLPDDITPTFEELMAMKKEDVQ